MPGPDSGDDDADDDSSGGKKKRGRKAPKSKKSKRAPRGRKDSSSPPGSGGPGAAPTSGDDPGFTVQGGVVTPTGAGAPKRGTKLAGGRWTQYVVKGLIVAVLLVLVLNGVYRLAGRGLGDAPTTAATDRFPTQLASGYATRFAETYLSWDEERPDFRAEQLKAFFPASTSQQLGWDGKGVQQVLGSAIPLGVKPKDDKQGVVTVSAYINPGGWTCMDIAVNSPDQGRSIAVTSYTAFVACPTVPGVQVPDKSSQEQDDALEAALTATLQSFFKSYAAGTGDLSQTTTKNSGITGLRNTVQLAQVNDLVVPVVANGGDPNARTIQVGVSWKTAGGGLIQQTYELDVVKQVDRWLISAIRGGIPSPEVAPQRPGVAPQVSPNPFASQSPSAPPTAGTDVPTPTSQPSAGQTPTGAATPSTRPTPSTR